MSAGSFHMALFESRVARVDRRTRENHANGRLLVAGAYDLLADNESRPDIAEFTDHSSPACGCAVARDGAAHPHLRAQADPARSASPRADGEAGSATNFRR